MLAKRQKWSYCCHTWEACSWEEGSARKVRMVSMSSKGREDMLGPSSTSFKGWEEMLWLSSTLSSSKGREEIFELWSASSNLLEIHIVSSSSTVTCTQQLDCAYGQTCCHLLAASQLASFRQQKANFHFTEGKYKSAYRKKIQIYILGEDKINIVDPTTVFWIAVAMQTTESCFALICCIGTW